MALRDSWQWAEAVCQLVHYHDGIGLPRLRRRERGRSMRRDGRHERLCTIRTPGRFSSGLRIARFLSDYVTFLKRNTDGDKCWMFGMGDMVLAAVLHPYYKRAASIFDVRWQT
jgi:hypothetical protein